MKNLYQTFITGNQKAIIGFVLTLIAGLGLQVGGVNILDVTVRELVSAIGTAVVTGVGVWVTRNK